MRPCFKFVAAATNKPAVLSLMEEIGFWGMQSKDFREQLDKVEGDDLVVEIDSPGGDVFAGNAMYHMLRNSGKKITTRVLGVAASAASVVAMAGDEIEMPENSFMMVHNPWGVAIGNADEMRETADVLDKIGGSLTKVYTKRTGKSEDEIKAMLSKDTWMTADECLELGFCTKITDKVEAQATFDMDRADLPEAVRAVYKAKKAPTKPESKPEPKPADPPVAKAAPTPQEVGVLCKAAGLEAFADQFAVEAETLDGVNARIAAAKDITALCALAKRPNDAKGHIKANRPVAEVRAALVKAMASADEHTDTTQPIKQTTAPAAKSTEQVYQEREARRAARRNSTRK